MLIYFTEAGTGNSIAVNPTHVVCVFEQDIKEVGKKTVINLLNGNVAVEEKVIDVVGTLQGQL
jgi:hypothetical protein